MNTEAGKRAVIDGEHQIRFNLPPLPPHTHTQIRWRLVFSKRNDEHACVMIIPIFFRVKIKVDAAWSYSSTGSKANVPA